MNFNNFSDYNNIILWDESEDINIKALISKISAEFQFYVFKLGMIYVRLIPSIDYCVELKSCWWDFLWKLLSICTEMVLALFLWGKCAS